MENGCVVNSPPTAAVCRTPLADCPPVSGNRFSLCEIPFTGKIILRGKADDTAFANAIQNTLGMTLPVQPNTAATNNGETLLWLGPEEWLLWTTDDNRQRQLDTLNAALASAHTAVVDVSDYYTIIRLSGKNADAVLAHGCPLNLDDTFTQNRQCAQSRFRNAAILLVKTDVNNSFDLQVRWSFARYLWDYLNKVGKMADAASQTPDAK